MVRKDAGGQQQGKGSLGATDKRVANQGDAYAKFIKQRVVNQKRLPKRQSNVTNVG